jgi:propanol-preferring alcohol dehydrogenase
MLAGELEPGQRVGIIGLGGLGMTGARVAVLNGASVYAAEPREQVWDTARRSGVLDLASRDLDLVVDFAGFETTTADAIRVVRPGGLVVQVGLGRKETTIPTFELVLKAVTLRGARGGMPGAIDAVLRHMTSGELAIEAATIGFDEIPEGLARLDRGGVVGRLVAVVGQ